MALTKGETDSYWSGRNTHLRKLCHPSILLAEELTKIGRSASTR